MFTRNSTTLLSLQKSHESENYFSSDRGTVVKCFAYLIIDWGVTLNYYGSWCLLVFTQPAHLWPAVGTSQ